MLKENPYEKCPIYESEHFCVRLVEEKDAEDLLMCYSDPASAELFNTDNCHHDFICRTSSEVEGYIQYWLEEYRGKGFVRFSVIDKLDEKAVGTIEMFVRKEKDNRDNGSAFSVLIWHQPMKLLLLFLSCWDYAKGFIPHLKRIISLPKRFLMRKIEFRRCWSMGLPN
ncbi:hypothetical protein [Paenibacillus sp.]|jgi:hypothetical protein|uniref:GNAT family N-acetyltransferase n=1 Tax=Paenibacillus sp. TaxID=58172 RepID=UPI0028334410|nr:hypothetical protein [Paenibacillus sp.]MDR0270514.1 hypothetical protein [Paenibacillus sp.]